MSSTTAFLVKLELKPFKNDTFWSLELAEDSIAGPIFW